MLYGVTHYKLKKKECTCQERRNTREFRALSRRNISSHRFCTLSFLFFCSCGPCAFQSILFSSLFLGVFFYKKHLKHSEEVPFCLLTFDAFTPGSQDCIEHRGGATTPTPPVDFQSIAAQSVHTNTLVMLCGGRVILNLKVWPPTTGSVRRFVFVLSACKSRPFTEAMHYVLYCSKVNTHTKKTRKLVSGKQEIYKSSTVTIFLDNSHNYTYCFRPK